MKKVKKYILISCAAAGIAIILAVIFMIQQAQFSFPTIDPSTLTPDQQKTLASLQEIDDHPLYFMRYYGDYSEFLKLKEKYYKQFGLPKPECSTIAALNETGHKIVGYNSDREDEPLLLLYTDPQEGYASVSIIHLYQCFGFGFDKNTPFDSEQKKTLLLYAPYLGATGMNEAGVAITGMSIPGGSFPLTNPGKESKVASEMYRYILDHAKNTEDAVRILSEYNIGFPQTITIPQHWLVADASGRSAVIEWEKGALQVIWNTENWQVATNFQLYGAQGKIDSLLDEFRKNEQISRDINGISYFRYAAAWEALRKENGLIEPDKAKDILRSISLSKSKDKDIWFDTVYSVVYDLSTGDFQIILDKNYDQAKKFSIYGFQEKN